MIVGWLVLSHFRARASSLFLSVSFTRFISNLFQGLTGLHPSSRSILMPCPRAGRLNAVLSPYVMSRAKYFPIRPQLTESIYFIWLLLLRLLLCITSCWTARLFPAQLERSLADLICHARWDFYHHAFQ